MAKKYDHTAITERILSLIKSRNLTKYRLAKEIGVSETTLSSNFNRGSKWSVEVLSAMTDYFNVSLDYLITGIEPENSYRERLEKLTSINTEYSKTISKLTKENTRLRKAINLLSQVPETIENE